MSKALFICAFIDCWSLNLRYLKKYTFNFVAKFQVRNTLEGLNSCIKNANKIYKFLFEPLIYIILKY